MVAKAISPKLRGDIRLTVFDSSALEPTYLAELPDGRRLLISYPLYQLLFLCDGKRTLSEIAETLSRHFNGQISVSQVEKFIEQKVKPQGFFQQDVDHLPINDKRPSAWRSPIQLLVKIPLLSPRQLNPITAITQHFFAKPVIIVMVLLITLVHFLTYVQLSQLVPSFHLRDLTVRVYGPFFTLVIFGALWHEFGHLSACRHFGCEHGKLGCGLYMIWPVFYVDTTPTWRLPRWQRVVVDLGGFYFQMILAAILYAVSLFTHLDSWLLAVIIAMDMSIVHNLNPMFKFDGYWLLSDIIGVPNLHKRIGEYLKEMLPFTRKQKANPLLRTQLYAKMAARLYALFCATFFAYFFVIFIWLGPGMIRQYPEAITYLGQQVWNSLWDRDIIQALGSLVTIFFSSMPLLALCLMLIRLLAPVLEGLRKAMPSLKLQSSRETE